jgi:hypothetical protein
MSWTLELLGNRAVKMCVREESSKQVNEKRVGSNLQHIVASCLEMLTVLLISTASCSWPVATVYSSSSLFSDIHIN